MRSAVVPLALADVDEIFGGAASGTCTDLIAFSHTIVIGVSFDGHQGSVGIIVMGESRMGPICRCPANQKNAAFAHATAVEGRVAFLDVAFRDETVFGFCLSGEDITGKGTRDGHGGVMHLGGLLEKEGNEAGAPWPGWPLMPVHIEAHPRALVLSADFNGMDFQMLLG